tara:strand:- start:247 stop:633 length:387 start_codon:yes stop_codon:yes gene_type:complete
MFQRRPRRFRRRINGRNRSSRHHDNVQERLRSNSFSNGQTRNNFRGSPQSAEKLFEKYSVLAKEALSSGDKTLSENYYQHADHFMRIIEDKNRNQTQNKVQGNEKPTVENKDLSENNIPEQEKIIKGK